MNVASGTGSAVAAGTHNVAGGANSFVGAGTFNAANGQGSFVGAGTSNVANATSALVIGGFDNQATVIDALVVAGAGNRATGARSVVVGGGYNLAGGGDSGLCGGFSRGNVPCTNAASHGAAVCGGLANVASGVSSVVGGGFANLASGFNAVVPGGIANVASGGYSFAAAAGAADQDGCAILAFWSSSLATPLTCLGSQHIVRIGAGHGFSVDYHTQRLDGGGTRWVSLGDGIAGATIATWNGASLTDAGV